MSAVKATKQKNTSSLHYAGKGINCGSELDVADEMRRAAGISLSALGAYTTNTNLKVFGLLFLALDSRNLFSAGILPYLSLSLLLAHQNMMGLKK